MEWGTPLHAFDYNRVKNGTINVRYGKKGEKLPLLDKSEIILNDMDLVIADPEKSIALAGVMGGGNSEVTDTTTSILLEAAQFAPGTVRRSSKTHQKKSDSSHRFERQIDSQAVSIASQRAASLIQELSGGKIFSGTVSAYSQTGKKNLEFKGVRKCKLDVKKLNRFLGTSELSLDLTKKLLQEIEFKSEVKSEILEVSIPSFRPDVEMEQDLFEEVLRVWGYDKVEPKVPSLHHLPESTSAVDLRAGIIQKIKSVFVINGFSEAMNYAFTSRDKNTFWGGEKCKEFIVELANPLNLDFAVMKTNLVCGLFDNLKNAFHHQQNDARFFEIRPVYFKNQNSETGVLEEWRIAALLTGQGFQ
jgi:phenylalanyl-tRNA synthetase beta chain